MPYIPEERFENTEQIQLQRKRKEFYSKEERDRVLKASKEPTNEMRGMTEATGLKILDGIYILIKTLRELGGHGA